MAGIMRQIEEDLDWRTAELATIKVLVRGSYPNSPRRAALLRALWALLYAHFEGFCKFAWDLYLSEIEKAIVARRDCRDELARLSLEKEFRNLRKDLSSSKLWQFCAKDFSVHMSERTAFGKLETRYNLNSDLFLENMQSFGILSNKILEHRNRINALVTRRNEIAHGRKNVISSLDEYMEYENAAEEVMIELALMVEDEIEHRKFVKQR